MPDADLVINGTVVTVDPAMPVAQSIAVGGGRILAVGGRDELAGLAGPATRTIDLGDACVLPGFVEAHGHVTIEATVLGTMVDIRPVTVSSADEVVATVRRAVAERGRQGAYLNGWDPLLQPGLPEPTLAWLDGLAPDTPLAIVHNSGHSVYFNSRAAQAAQVTRDTPDPAGASFGRDAAGALTGAGYEVGAVFAIIRPALAAQPDQTALLRAECQRLNRAGITTCSDMSFDPSSRPQLAAARAAGALTARLRLYEMSGPQLASQARPGEGDDLVRQVGIKTWADGSPWVGNIATSFPYLDTPATRSIGLEPHHRGRANYSAEQLARIADAYFPAGWQLACHAHGDLAVEMVLDVWEDLLRRHPRDDHRLRLEHVGAMQPRQFARAASLGVTCSLFVDHLYYWGDVLTDGLFGPVHGARWAAAGSAVAAGLRVSFHNDPPVTPEEPLRNLAVAVTRASRSGRVLAPEERLTVEQALRAQTIDAAWQLFADDVVGSLTPGKYADLVVLSADPRAADPDKLADLEVLATFLEGRQVHGAAL